MSKRIPVEPGLQTPQLAPAAEPVNVYYHPQLPAPVLKPIIDLSPLSEAALKISQDQQDLRAKKDVQGGKNAYLAAQTELALAATGVVKNQSAWAKAVAAGTVPEGVSPWTRVGAMEMAGQQLMDQYGRDLQNAMDSVSRAQDDKGNPVVPAAPEQAIAEVWKKYAANPIFKDFYASKAAADMKPKIDSGFLGQVALQRGENLVEYRFAQATQQQASYLNSLAVKGDPWTPDTYAQFKEWQDTQLHGRSMKEIHKSTMDAVKTVAANEAALDPNAAAAFIDHAMGLPSGTTTLGQDVRTGTELVELKRRYLYDAEVKSSKARQEKAQARSDTLTNALDTGLQIMSKAIDGGLNPIDAVNTEVDRIRKGNVYGDLTGTVASSLEELARNRSTVSTPGLENHLREEIAAGHTTDLKATMLDLVHTGALAWDSYRKLGQEVDQRQDVTALVEENPIHTRLQAEIKALVPKGIPDELGEALQAQAEQDGREATRDMAELAASLTGDPQSKMPELRKWANQRIADLTEKHQAAATSFKAARDTAIKTIADKTARHEGAVEDVKAAQANGLLSTSEAANMLGAAAAEAGGRWFMNQQSFADARSAIDRIVQEKVTEMGKLSDVQGQYGSVREIALSQLTRRYRERLAKDLANVPIEEIPDKSDHILDEVVAEVAKSIGDEVNGRMKAFADGGMSIGEASDKAQTPEQVQNDQTQAAAAVSAAEPTLGRDAYKQYLTLGRVPTVDPAVYDKIDGLVLDKNFHTRRPGVEQSVWEEATRITARPVEPGKEAEGAAQSSDALHSLARHVVIPWRDAAAGQLAVYPSALKVGHDSTTLGTLGYALSVELHRAGHDSRDFQDTSQGTGLVSAFTTSGGPGGVVFDPDAIRAVAIPGSPLRAAVDRYDGTLRLLRASKAVKVPLDPSRINASLDPFASSYADLEELTRTPAAINAILRSLGRPTDKESVTLWISQQTKAVEIAHPDLPNPHRKQ